MAAVTICSDYGAPQNKQHILEIKHGSKEKSSGNDEDCTEMKIWPTKALEYKQDYD